MKRAGAFRSPPFLLSSSQTFGLRRRCKEACIVECLHIDTVFVLVGTYIDLLGLSHEFFGRDREHKSRNRVKDGYSLHEVAVGDIDLDLWE